MDSIPPLPFWVRAVFALARVAQTLAAATAVLRDEMLLAWIPPARRDAITEALFARQRTYAPGGATYDGGLFDWEVELLALPHVPRTGRVLVGGAGGGREVAALRARGYQVVAFEPSAPLARAGADALTPDGTNFVRASYADLVRAANGDGGPLAAPLAALRGPGRGEGVDFVLLGWTSVSYVMEEPDRVALLRALRTLAPAAPVCLSFNEPTALNTGGRMATARRALRRLFATLGAPGQPRDRDRFLAWAGFFRESDPAEITALAHGSGYSVAFIASGPGRAVLVPEGTGEGGR